MKKNPYIHDPKTPTNFYKPRVIPEHVMNKHKHVHADLMAAYAADAQTTATPWELWEACDTKSHYPDNGRWYTLKSDPSWNPSFAYRRKPKTNSQVACELLDKAYDALEGHSVIVCEPNVDHIQRLVLDAKLLLQMPEDKPALKQHTIVLTTEQLKEVILACEFPSWENEDFLSAEQILLNALNGEVK
jgi:hypothetical protein